MTNEELAAILEGGESSEARIERRSASRGPSPEDQVLIDRNEAVGRLLSEKSTGSSNSAAPASEPMGIYPDDGPTNDGVLTAAPNYRAAESGSEAVFQDEGSFQALTNALSETQLSSVSDNAPVMNINHWTPPKKAAPYLESIREAEEAHDMPENLVAAIASAESSFDPKAVSPVGARGLMQIMPEYHPGVDTDDPETSIAYGAEYVAKLKDQFGTWELALAAYNWGPGNLRKYGIENAPKETRDYIKKIMGKIHLEDEHGA